MSPDEKGTLVEKIEERAHSWRHTLNHFEKKGTLREIDREVLQEREAEALEIAKLVREWSW